MLATHCLLIKLFFIPQCLLITQEIKQLTGDYSLAAHPIWIFHGVFYHPNWSWMLQEPLGNHWLVAVAPSMGT